MSDLFELHEQPDLDEPVLFLGLEGWIDAGHGASSVADTITSYADTILVASFDTDRLIDYRARRPVVHLVEGSITDLTWPTVELVAVADSDGREALLLQGSEPDFEWMAFSGVVADLALQFDARLTVALGSYPAAVPHTRPCRVTATGTSRPLVEQIGFVGGRLDVPGGLHAVIETKCASAGIPGVGLWAQVPHYAGAMAYPAAGVALLQAIEAVAGRRFDLGELPVQAAAVDQRLDRLIARSDEHQRLVAKLEQQADQLNDQDEELPTGDELAEELQRFLRDHDGEDD